MAQGGCGTTFLSGALSPAGFAPGGIARRLGKGLEPLPRELQSSKEGLRSFGGSWDLCPTPLPASGAFCEAV